MRFAPLAGAVVIAGPLLAGCLAGDDVGPPPTSTPDLFLDPFVSKDPDHRHQARAAHELRYRMEEVAHLALTDLEGESARSHSIDLCDRWVVLGREFPGTYGVDIVDVSDPSAPLWVGKYRDPNAVPGDRDVAWSADCNYVFMGNQGATPDTSGVLLINARDKSRPAFESRYLIPGASAPVGGAGLSSGVHTVYALKVGADQYVYALNYGVHILRMQPGLDGRQTLVLVGRYVAVDPDALAAVNQGSPDTVATRRTVYGHDMTVYRQGPQTLLYAAYAYAGLRIVDVTDPTTPREVAAWIPRDTPGAPHYVHSVKSYLRPDGQRITVVGSETFEDRNTDVPSPLWVLDTTDVSQIRLLATWTNPGRHGSDHLLFSLHFFEVERDLVWLTHYHGGVWVLDLADPGQPEVRGYILPSHDTGYEPPNDCCLGFKLSGIPMTFDIKVRDGVAYAADFSTGLYVVRLAAAR